MSTAGDWDGALQPAADLGVGITADEVVAFITETAEALVVAGDADDFTDVAHLVTAPLYVHLQRRDRIADRLGDGIEGLTGIEVAPYGGRVVDTDLRLHVRVTYRMHRPTESVTDQVRRETWQVNIPLARLRHATGPRACTSCGAPGRVLAACHYCATPATVESPEQQPRVSDISPG